jgi:hypothetical protein
MARPPRRTIHRVILNNDARASNQVFSETRASLL